MYDSDEKITKWKVEVQVELDGGERLVGTLFIKPMQRLSDLLNDDRRFLPLQTPDGLIIHLRKDTLTRVTQLDQQAEHDGVTDPYEILGVPRHICDDELKRVYHDLCSQSHPDKLQSLGVSAELIDSANSRMIRIIDAYHRILAERGHVDDTNEPSDPVAAAAS